MFSLLKNHLSRKRQSALRAKVFVIGLNHTGTTSMQEFLRTAGYKVAPQREFELLRDSYRVGNWGNLLELIDMYDGFQDSPFSRSTPEFISTLRSRYPDAKFILTVRDSPETWYGTLERLHRKNWYGFENPITWDQVKSVNYVHPDFLYTSIIDVVGSENHAPYDPKIWKAHYLNYVQRCRDQFSDKSSFLEINLKESGAAQKLQEFLELPNLIAVPHLNSSRKVKY